MHLVDFLLLATVALVMPVVGALSYRRFVKKIESGEDSDLMAQYQSTFLVEWALFAALTAIWITLDRNFAALGLTAPRGAGEFAGLAIVIVMSVFLILSRRKAQQISDEERATNREALGTIQHFLPRTRRDLNVFYGLSVTAGIVEELLYRGYFFWLFAFYMPIWAVVLLSSFIFALGHTYQGLSGMAQVFLIGIAFGGLYLLTGSIWVPIVAHALLDILQGRVLHEYVRDTGQKPPADAEPAA